MKEIFKRACVVTFVALLVASMLAPFVGFVGTTSATEHDTYVFSGGDDQYARAWTDDNTQKWSGYDGNDVYSVIAGTNEDYMYSGDAGGDITKRHAGNGSTDWTQNYGGSNVGVGREGLSYHPTKDELYATFSNGDVKAINPSDGSVRWNVNFGDNMYGSAVGPEGDYLYVSHYPGVIYKLHASNGSTVWSTSAPNDYGRPVIVGPDGNYVYHGDNNGVVHKFRASDGSTAQTASIGMFAWDLAIDENGGYVYATNNNGELYKLDSADLSTVWTQTLPDGTGEGVAYNKNTGKLYSSSGSNVYNIDKTNTDSPTLAFGDHTAAIEDIAAGYAYSTTSELSGTVSDAQNGTSIGNATLDVYQSGTFVKSAETASDGSYTVSLEDGDYTVKASKIGYETKEKNVTVSGATTADFALNGLYDIDGYVKENTKEGDAISDATVKVLQNGTQEYSAVTNSSGYYEINDIIGGNYTFNVSALGYQDHSSEKYVDQSKQIGFRLNNKEDEYVPYMEFKTPAWIPSNDSRPYHVYFSDENGDYKEVTEDANVTSLNVSRVKVNVTSLELEGQPGINATVNVTAEYTYKGTDYKQTNELVVAKLETAQLEILPPSHRISAFLRDTNVQMIIVAIIVGTTAAYLTSNPFAGLGGIQLALMIAWANGRVNTGILLVGFYYMLFSGMLGMQVRKQRH